MAAIGTRYYTPNQFEVDANGVPMASAQLWFYETQTNDLQDTFQNVDLTTPNTNPVIADANGRFGDIWLIPSLAYKVQLYTAATVENPDGTQIWSMDPVGPASGGVPSNDVGIVGELRLFAGPSSSVPSGWYLCYGQAVSRTTFASLFAIIGTTWGAGDTTTTFNLPDFRGRAPFGKDDMGGSAASRLTSGVSGVAGATLGATGGNQATQTHTHTVNDGGHTHAITDSGHSHVQRIGFTPLTSSATTWTTTGSSGTATNMPLSTASATTGITNNTNTTGITIDNYGAGSSQNVPPAGVVNVIIYAGA